MELIDTHKLLSLRPSSVRPRLGPRDETLPLSPATLLPALGAPLLEVPLAWGGFVQPLLRGATSMDAPLCISLDAEGGPEKGGPRGLHQAVGAALQHARKAGFRRPLVIHARLGLVDPDDEAAVDHARLRVLEAVDAGATSVQLGAFGDAGVVARMLKELLLPADQNGVGVVVQLLDSEQATVVPAELQHVFDVDAYVAPATVTLQPRRESPAEIPVAPFPAWVDGTGLFVPTIKALLKDTPDLGPALHALWEKEADPNRDRLEMRLYERAELVLEKLGARGSAGDAMVRLSRDEPAVEEAAE